DGARFRYTPAAHHWDLAKPRAMDSRTQLVMVGPVRLANRQEPVSAEQRSLAEIERRLARLLEHLRPEPLPAFLLHLARLFQCPPDRGPFVPVRAQPADQKCNRAERCGVQPISDEATAPGP